MATRTRMEEQHGKTKTGPRARAFDGFDGAYRGVRPRGRSCLPHRPFTVSGDLADLTDEAIVMHGMTVDGNHVPTLPVACGQIS